MTHELIGSLGTGSAIAEAAFAIAGVPLALTDVPYLEPGPARERLLALNPLGQVPTLVLPDGSVMTESAAMVLYASELAPDAGLAPPPGDPDRARFLNLLVVIVAAIYPSFTYGDDPAQFTGTGPAADALKAATTARAKRVWSHIEAGVSPAPHVLGARFSALDAYLAVMLNWRPGRAWFADATPKLDAARAAAAARPEIAAVLARHDLA